MSNYLPYGHHWIDDSDINAVIEVMHSGWLTQGSKVTEFERELASHFDAKYAVVFSSGTAALHAAYFSVGLKRGDTIITTPITFVATSNAAQFLGSDVSFVDIDPDTANIEVSLIEDKIEKRTKGIVPVDFAGQPADLDEIRAIADIHGLFVVEDACHAIGSTYKGKKIGSLSDISVFSFHPVKNITTGEGGAALTNDEELFEKLIMFRHHGITKEPNKMKRDFAPWSYEMHYLGNNYRLTDIQCALGLSQLKKLDYFVARRRQIVNLYNEAFTDVDEIEPLKERNDRMAAWHLYVIQLKLDKMNKTRLAVFNELKLQNIGVQVHYMPVYRQPFYEQLGFRPGLCPNAEKYYESAITLPLFPSMKDADIQRVEQAVINAVCN
jgi:UDP-4-amino-4,6-dideoxy-N-acetyl-beta-L-altrosamine transaminase